jgi:hypothetical protein
MITELMSLMGDYLHEKLPDEALLNIIKKYLN